MREINFKRKTILAIGAHPDDIEFGSGATLAKAARKGAEIYFVVATNGQRGSSDKSLSPEKLSEIRKKEEIKAAKVLGAREVHFLDHFDGELMPDIHLKEQLASFIRKYKPDIVFGMDPSRFYYKEYGMVNHSDHRAIGEATLDAVYPLARDALSFPEHSQLGLKPHKVKELLMPARLTEDANYFSDVTDTIQIKIKALSCHRSQVGDIKILSKRMTDRAADIGKTVGLKFAEAFVRLTLPE